jgi:iron-desferrioxamine transport system substrate-binding protein
MTLSPSPSTSRRRFLGFSGGVALAGLLAACGDSRPGSPAAPTSGAATGPWTFTDDRGRTASLPSRPTRIVMQVNAGAALVDLGVTPVGVFGPRTLANGKPDPQAGDVAPGVASVGTNFGEFDMERYLALKPELLVTISYSGTLWYIPADSASEIEAKAPIVAIELGDVSAPDAIAKFEKLAASLGADVNTAPVADARADFEAAGKELAQATAAKPGLKTLVVQGTTDTLRVAKPGFYSDLRYYGQQGLDLIAPRGGSEPTWEELSWEQAATYPADLILTDARSDGLPQSELAKIPTWSQLPAVEAGQLGLWHAETPMSYRKLAPVIRELTGVVSRSRAGIVA